MSAATRGCRFLELVPPLGLSPLVVVIVVVAVSCFFFGTLTGGEYSRGWQHEVVLDPARLTGATDSAMDESRCPAAPKEAHWCFLWRVEFACGRLALCDSQRHRRATCVVLTSSQTSVPGGCSRRH